MNRFFCGKKFPSRQIDPFAIQEGKVKDGDLSGLYRHRWVEESIGGTRGGNTPLKEYIGLAISRRRIFFAAGAIAMVLLIFLGRLWQLQYWRGEHYRQIAESNRLRSKPIVAERGIFLDRRLIPLASNIPNFSLCLLPQELPVEPSLLSATLEKVAYLSGVPALEIQESVAGSLPYSFRAICLRDNIDYDTAIKLIVAAADLPVISIERSYSRLYFFTDNASSTAKNKVASSLAHLLGYMGKPDKDELKKHPEYLSTDYLGKTGLEKHYEEILRGSYGLLQVEIDALGREKNIVKETPPVAGKNLLLTLDLSYQQKLEQILREEMRFLGKKRASAVAMDPRNGEILAIVNLPSFDNNLFAQGISAEEYQNLLTDKDAPLFSRAWSGSYPSGSVVKPVVATAALTEGVITKNTTFLSNGGLQVDKWFFPDWKTKGHGLTNVIKAMAESVNTFFFIVGGGYGDFTGLGLDRLTVYFKRFGLGNTLGVDLPNESAGFIPTREWKEDTKKESWYIGDTYNISIGQGDLLVTPLQVAAYTAAVANDGTLYRPHLVMATQDPETKQKTILEPQIISQNIAPVTHLATVRRGMRAAVTVGSARAMAGLPITVAGKTGTAQWSKKAENHAWFTSFAPYENPKIILTILIEEGGEGSATAVPVAQRFYQWLAQQGF